MFPVSFCNASGHGLLEPNLSISANIFPASFEPDISHFKNGVPGSATLHNDSKNWNWRMVRVKYLKNCAYQG